MSYVTKPHKPYYKPGILVAELLETILDNIDETDLINELLTEMPVDLALKYLVYSAETYEIEFEYMNACVDYLKNHGLY